MTFRLIYLIALSLLCAPTLHAQTYAASYLADIRTINGEERSGSTVLQFNSEASVYFHPEWPVENQYTKYGNAYKIVYGDSDKMRVYTDLSNNLQVYDCHMYHGPHGWIFTNFRPKFDWQIQDSLKQVAGLQAVLATTHYGGRDYEAWFAPEIPYPVGPYRFGGLPGLIVEMHSTDEYVNYVLESFGKIPADEADIHPPREGEHTDRDRLRKRMIARLLRTEANSPPEWNDTIDDPDPNYDIEKGTWNFFSVYKANRDW